MATHTTNAILSFDIWSNFWPFTSTVTLPPSSNIVEADETVTRKDRGTGKGQ